MATNDRPNPPPTVVLLHHFGGSRRTWSAVAERLGGICLVIAPDQAGFGGSPPVAGRPFTVENWADDVISRCDALAVGRMLVVGHSMSGRVAMAIAARRPDRVVGMVLVAPSPPTPEPMTDDGRASLLAAYEDRHLAEEQVRQISGSVSDEQVSAAADDIAAADAAAWRAWAEVGSRQDLSSLVAAVRCPVVVLSGDRDGAIATDVVEREVVAKLPQARLVRVPGAGHLLPVESPDAVTDAIRSMLVPSKPTAVDSVRDLIETDLVTPPTRRALQERAAWRSTGPRFFTAAELATMAAVCDAMVPQDHVATPIDIAGEIDRRLADGGGDGWRYAQMPPDGEAHRRGLAAVDEIAGGRFADQPRAERLAILTALRDGTADEGPWRSRGLVGRRVLEEWLAGAVEVYYSHPAGGYADMAYVGFADARGWRRVGLNQLEPQERMIGG